jgi:hypothetical protein
MKQEFVYHALARRTSRSRASTSTAAVAVTEYVTYIATLSIAVVIAIITFAYAANITVRWLDAVSKPGFFDTALVQKSAPKSSGGWEASVQPIKFAAATANANR